MKLLDESDYSLLMEKQIEKLTEEAVEAERIEKIKRRLSNEV